MQWLILMAASFAAMALCLLVFALKVHRTGKLHNCTHPDGCQCHGNSLASLTSPGDCCEIKKNGGA